MCAHARAHARAHTYTHTRARESERERERGREGGRRRGENGESGEREAERGSEGANERPRRTRRVRWREAKVGRSEEGSNALRPELAAIASTLQAASPKSDLLYLCDSETARSTLSI